MSRDMSAINAIQSFFWYCCNIFSIGAMSAAISASSCSLLLFAASILSFYSFVRWLFGGASGSSFRGLLASYAVLDGLLDSSWRCLLWSLASLKPFSLAFLSLLRSILYESSSSSLLSILLRLYLFSTLDSSGFLMLIEILSPLAAALEIPSLSSWVVLSLPSSAAFFFPYFLVSFFGLLSSSKTLLLPSSISFSLFCSANSFFLFFSTFSRYALLYFRLSSSFL